MPSLPGKHKGASPTYRPPRRRPGGARLSRPGPPSPAAGGADGRHVAVGKATHDPRSLPEQILLYRHFVKMLFQPWPAAA